tara:strand:+ start:358 stop:750 length:393 start_codon:yes stop_codon:yes gene_type:complete
MTYYVYGTFISRNRFKFKTKEEANAFRQWADEKKGIGKSEIGWVFPPSTQTQQNNGFEIIEPLMSDNDNWDCINGGWRATEARKISRPVKARSLWNRLINYFWFYIDLNKVQEWRHETPVSADYDSYHND